MRCMQQLFIMHHAVWTGFKCVVVLPKGTNLDVVNTHATAEDKLLAASNKWLIAHEDAHIDGAFNGLRGENITV